MLKLGSLSLRSRVLLAPLEGVSDCGFRAVCYGNGAGLTFTEMVRASALGRGNAAAAALIDTHDSTTLTGVQLLASTPDELRRALDYLSKGAKGAFPHWANIVAIDLNFGCPSPAVIRDGAGPALLHRRARLAALFSALARWRDEGTVDCALRVKAVGVKLRLGLNQREAHQGVFVDAARAAADAGLDWVTLHARHAGQKSSDAPDWRAFGTVSKVLDRGGCSSSSSSHRTKFFANGDITNGEDGDKLISSGVCDGVMLARAAIRNPWIFRNFANVGEVGRREVIAPPLGPTLRPSSLSSSPPSSLPSLLPSSSSVSPQTTTKASTFETASFKPSFEDVTVASQEWARLSALTPGGAREKHVDFNKSLWARLLREAGGGGGSESTFLGSNGVGAIFPRNEHLS